MENIVDKLKRQESLYSLNGATEEEIRAAEQTLALIFDKEYWDYLQAFGLVSFPGHELTGIVKSSRLNVVAQTFLAKETNPHIPNDFYVVEITNIDGIIIWQNGDGKIFKTIYDRAPELICNSLADYIEGNFI